MFKTESRFRALGTDIFLVIVCADESDKKRAEIDLVKVKKIYLAQEKIFSRFDTSSELSFLNNHLGRFNKASEDILEISQLALQYNLETKGLFDPRIMENLEDIGYKKDFQQREFVANLEKIRNISGKLEDDLRIEGEKVFFERRMDFSGIAKGYITDKIKLFLKERGWENFLVDSGGDIVAHGLDEKKEKWKIGLENIPEEKMLLEISNEAVATSGITRRKWKIGEQKFHHLVNPKKATEFNFELQSVTVIGKDAVEADVWAKTLFLMGRERGMEFSQANKIKVLFLDYKGRLFVSEKAKENLLK